MQTITLEITNEHAIEVLQELQEKKFIKILSVPNSGSYALPGKPLTVQEFSDWVTNRENGPTVSLKEAKATWAKQRKQLQKSVK